LRALPVQEQVVRYLERYDRIVVVEMNRDGQLAAILRAELPELAPRIHAAAHLDGLPFSAEQVQTWLAPHLDAVEADA
jgi:2-oxoglutarate ferredoxin oxidoreductase subunit alpha